MLLVGLFYHLVSPERLWAAARTVDAGWLLSGLLVAGSITSFRSLRWNLLCRQMETVIPWSHTLRAMYVAAAFALVTPARIGMEFYRFLYVRPLAPSLFVAIRCVIIDRFFDLIPMVMISLVGLGFFPLGLDPWLLAGPVALLLLATIPFLLLLTQGSSRWAAKGIDHLQRRWHLGHASQNEDEPQFDPVVHTLGWQALSGLLLISLALSAIQALSLGLFARAVGLELDGGFVWWCSSLTVICNFLPVSQMGVGTRDATLIFLFNLVHGAPEQAILVSTMVLAGWVLSGALGVVFLWLGFRLPEALPKAGGSPPPVT
ncbi:MAG: flippase-like domain-containing protein [Magnetococcales bacterium]|nr:flippase-like domain-containing protein [Magnetococcales bacterium]